MMICTTELVTFFLKIAKFAFWKLDNKFISDWKAAEFAKDFILELLQHAVGTEGK